MAYSCESSKNYAIYVAERLEAEQDDPSDAWYHTFLLLVDKTGTPVTVLQQLHFNDDEHGNLLPNVRVGLSDPNKFQGIKTYPLVKGDAPKILAAWNEGLLYSFYLKHKGIAFSENYKHGIEAVNCRSAIIATLQSIGLETRPEFFAAEAGTGCKDIPISKVFDFAAKGKLPWDEIVRKNQDYQRLLDAPWISGGRYVGPVMHPFKPM